VCRARMMFDTIAHHVVGDQRRRADFQGPVSRNFFAEETRHGKHHHHHSEYIAL
jgi:hypothetical protein